ncbi:hypothetical protein BDV38DRAFT_102360 [Aspergillus pseudotamarii]|uniref:Uncharacterized protein n=1 Tax=Aspergillus pseudotamarii TaxID=132259 RepID=A0A5N6SQI3_ASPPS|nr:uncharacterized protein BDV38DRAFT_102360 [Aspergillus pseudotamarii]KAE8136845.1 hypothetical protein BDV38DRAFT_102360 [Aspergillus pseudotamarii]
MGSSRSYFNQQSFLLFYLLSLPSWCTFLKSLYIGMALYGPLGLRSNNTKGTPVRRGKSYAGVGSVQKILWPTTGVRRLNQPATPKKKHDELYGYGYESELFRYVSPL